MKRPPQSLQTLLKHNNTLAKLQQQSTHLQQLTVSVRQHLPATVGRHLLMCNYSNACLTLFTRTAAQATVLRLASKHLLLRLYDDAQLQSTYKNINRIRIRISMGIRHRPDHHKKSTALTRDSARLLEKLAETMIDPALKDILQRLSKRR